MSPEPPADSAERLHKVMARAGVASRRVCEELIAAGRVTVNGATARIGDRAAPADRIEVDGAVVAWDAATLHFLVNKPRGVLSAASDDRGRRCVTDLVPAAVRVYPVGRLDADSEGLIIVTNDGELTHRLTHPSWGVEKEYLVHVEGVPSRGTLARLRNGVELDDGVTAPATVSDAPVADAPVVDAARGDLGGPQPPDPSHVRGRGSSGPALGADAHRAARRFASASWRAPPADGRRSPPAAPRCHRSQRLRSGHLRTPATGRRVEVGGACRRHPFGTVQPPMLIATPVVQLSRCGAMHRRERSGLYAVLVVSQPRATMDVTHGGPLA